MLILSEQIITRVTMTMSIDMSPSSVSMTTSHDAKLPLHETIAIAPDGDDANCRGTSQRVDRKVHFDEAKVVVQVENRKSLSNKERKRRWFSNDQFSRVKNECHQELEILKNSESADIFAYRGMEMIDPEAVVRRQRRHTNSISAVLIEQREQRSKTLASSTSDIQQLDKSPCNPKAIRKVYKRVVTDSIREALENAYIDKKAVQDYMSNAEEEVRIEYQRAKEETSTLARGKRGSLFPARTTCKTTQRQHDSVSRNRRSMTTSCDESFNDHQASRSSDAESLEYISRSLTKLSHTSASSCSKDGGEKDDT